MSLFRIIELYVIIPLQALAMIVFIVFLFRWMWRTSKIEKGNAKPAIRKKCKQKLCTAETQGRFMRQLRFKKNYVYVHAYDVDGKTYEIYDVIIYRIGEVIKLGPIPVSYTGKRQLENVDVVRIAYNPLIPQEAYLPDNQGKWTVF
ncbi:hypothetical protein [Streptococcus suis]|uniref:hypothetical protein n=1 Tax=Streptococcus suis TaxID=1307 RepID=UPI0004929990|nr:hypothetical protein [Streptococcus suis]